MTLFDSSVIIDARDERSPWHKWAVAQIKHFASTEGAAVNVIVLAEVSIRAENPETVNQELSAWGMELLPLPVSAAGPAAKAYASYLARRDKALPKTPQPDFFVGAHAQAEGLKLVTRDPARLKTYFPAVKLIVPQEQAEN
ncbi:MAG: PIN domain-containing protein [Verrucomicrobiota bacterium]|jgi:predicted nucleic acid-binding protein